MILNHITDYFLLTAANQLGLPFVMEKISGKGKAFIASYGTVVEKVLSKHEELVVDTHS
jgi:uncharacterized protein (AIM24 family)